MRLIVEYEYARFGGAARPRGGHITKTMGEIRTYRFTPMAVNVWHCNLLIIMREHGLHAVLLGDQPLTTGA